VKTEALCYLGERQIEIRALEIPEPGLDDVMVAMEACGICGWDIEAYSGRYGKHHPYPFCAGHEGVGRIVAKGDRVNGLTANQRVALHELPIDTPGGALLARHALRSQDQVTPIPEDNRPVHLWIVEPICCVLNGIISAGVLPGDRIAVVGTGYMGLLFIQGLRHCQAGSIAALETDSRRLALALRFGADEGTDPGTGLPEHFRRHFDVVVETAGNSQSLDTALTLARPGANIEIFAWHHHQHNFDLENWHVNGWSIINADPVMNPRFNALYPRCVDLMVNNTYTNEGLVTHVEKMEEAEQVFEAALDKRGGYIKGVITF
jgi:threonine dehydrogenase-like Zn-dependent dehydrogenase